MGMKKSRQTRLEAKGWRFGSAAEFLELTDEEAAFAETKRALSDSLRNGRAAQHMSQAALAKRVNSRVSRVSRH